MCFTDDDAIWNANFLKWLLVPFNDPAMGGTGSNQIMRPNDLTKPPTVYERIADMRLSGRMLEAAATTFYDGSVSCLSGRTALYHKRIINDSFPQEFTGEKWRNKCAALCPVPVTRGRTVRFAVHHRIFRPGGPQRKHSIVGCTVRAHLTGPPRLGAPLTRRTARPRSHKKPITP